MCLGSVPGVRVLSGLAGLAAGGTLSATQVDTQPRPGSVAALIGRRGGGAAANQYPAAAAPHAPRLHAPRDLNFDFCLYTCVWKQAGVCVWRAAAARPGGGRGARPWQPGTVPGQATQSNIGQPFSPRMSPFSVSPRGGRHPGLYVTLLDVFDNPGMKVGKRDSSSQFQKIDS